ncbi:MAG: SURF1 family protein [Alphaproteobacteria bacterium]|nr:SURF1 family protein [Alphaproteobacteria bacterium]
MQTKTARISFALFCVISIILTSMLGVWQVQRLSWKENLLSALEANQNKPPMLLEDVVQMDEGKITLQTLEGRRVILLGSYANSAPFFLVNQWKGQTLGVRPVELFNTRRGYRLYVVGSFQSLQSANHATPHPPESKRHESKTEVRLSGILRQASKPNGLGIIPNDLEKRMLVRVEPPALSALDHEKNVVASFYVDTNTQFYDARQSIRNNHLGYAITWFMLSFCLALFTLYHLRRSF